MHATIGRKVAAVFVLSLMVASCAEGPSTSDPTLLPPSSTPSKIPSITPSLTTEAIGIGGAASSEGESTIVAGTQAPESQPEDLQPSSCLIGTWSVVHESLVGYLTEAFEQSGLITLEFQSGSGDLFLTFDQDGITSFLADHLELGIGVPNIVTYHFIVQGDGLAYYAADEHTIATWGHVSALAGEVPGQSDNAPAVIQLTPEQIFIHNEGDLAWSDVPEDARLTEYHCDGNNLWLNARGTLRSEWLRVPAGG